MNSVEDNIRELDKQIGILLVKYNKEKDNTVKLELMEQINELTEIRVDLKASKVEGSNTGLWISGGLSIASILLVMHYEKTDVLTSKAYNIATKIFRM